MPGKVGVKIKAGRNLPVMDRSSDTTDAYVEIKLGNVTHKTDVCRKSLNPQWNTDWFRFEVDDAELQDEPLQIRLMDYDTYSANDAIGKVNISLNPLCLEMSGPTTHGKGTVLSGWIPVFDTMHGIRGEVNVIVKVDLFSDLNKFRQSSCGIPFFHSQCIPHGYRAQVIHGFVEELVVNDDPEYQWIDKIRTPRASNEARQVVFLKLSGQVQRKMGLKAINMGANAVIGYTQCFDLEGDVGVVARGIGTAVTLIKDTNTQSVSADNALVEESTKKYIEFLTGSHLNLTPKPGRVMQIRKAVSTNLFDFKHIPSTVGDDTDIMIDLIRQEDERGGKPVKKLRHKVKRFTHSSRTILNEKYNAFLRKFGDSTESKSPASTSLSLNSLLIIGGFTRDNATGTSSSERSSMFDICRRPSFKSKHKVTNGRHLAQRFHFKLSPHPIVRSISEDSSMKKSREVVCRTTGPGNISLSEYSDSTRSSPIIFAEEQPAVKTDCKKLAIRNCDDSICIGVKAGKDSYQPFGKFIRHAPHRLPCLNINRSDKPCSSESSSSETEFDSAKHSDCNDERLKMEKYLKMCDLDVAEQEHIDDRWIEPSDLDSVDDCLPELPERRSILYKLKALTHHVQDLLHKSKSEDSKPGSMISKQIRRIPPTNLALVCHKSDENQSYYSSQPEISKGFDLDSPATSRPKPFKRSYSLINISKFSETANLNYSEAFNKNINECNRCGSEIPFEAESHCSSTYLPLTVKTITRNCPVFKICPSTPTPSETDLKEFYFTDDGIATATIDDASLEASVIISPAIKSCTQTVVTAISVPEQFVNSPPLNLCAVSYQSVSTNISPSTPNLSPQHYLNAYSFNDTNNNHSNNKNSSLLASFSSPSSSYTPQLCIDHHRDHGHNRSLNEINSASSALVAAATAASSIDSPSLKRYTTPAQAAVVAAAAAVRNANSMAVAPSSATLINSNRDKMSPTSSKLTINVGAASSLEATPATTTTTTTTWQTALANNISPQMDGVSTSPVSSTSTVTSASIPTSTTSNTTAATVVPKESTAEMCRRSSDSDLSVTPKGNSLCVASERLVAATAMMRLSQPIANKTTSTDGMDSMMEYPFLTMTRYPPGFIFHLGATVAARSVKLLERVPNPDEPEVRDSWWTELRMEIRSHARALGCNVVLGYSEATTISDDVCVLSATGTAAVINMSYNLSVSQTDILTTVKPVSVVATSVGGTLAASTEDRDTLKDVRIGTLNDTVAAASLLSGTTHSGCNVTGKKATLLNMVKNSACNVCHVPYNLTSVPFNVKMKKCAICRKGRVPDVLLATLEVPEYLHVTGRGCFMQAQVVRAKKDLRSELNAKEISDGLPFLEYELHRVLINKLKAKGMNAIFGLKAQVAIGERMIALIATGTALFLTALPVPHVPKIVAGNSWTDKQKLNELQKKLQETFERNQEIYQLKCLDPDLMGNTDKQSDTDESDDEVIEIDLNCGNKDTCVLEVDDIEDLEIISLLMEPYPPEGFHVVNTQSVPGMLEMDAVKNLQMFTQVWRAKLDVNQNISGFPKHFQRLLQTIYFKLRTMIPCAICDLRFRLDLPESDQIQLLVTGMALGLGTTNKFKYRRKANSANGITDANAGNIQEISQSTEANGIHGNKRTLQEEDYIFPLDEDHIMVDTPTPTSNLPPYGLHSFKLAKTSPSRQQSKVNAVQRNRYLPLRDRYGVDITPLSFIPNGRIDKYLGNLNFFFIRETTSIRENGGISGFVHSFITELLAVVRAHISALGGNAMVSFYMSELILVDNQHKNQGQCLISIGGDAVYVSYHTDD